MTDLRKQRCVPCEGGARPMTRGMINIRLGEVDPGWALNDAATEIAREFRFADFHETMAFVNAVAGIAHAEDHHPDMEVGYNRCRVRYSTHAINGLSENDFICAAKIDALPADD